MQEYPQKRKLIRLQEYDYSRNGAYFITICTKDRESLLCSIAVGANCVRPVLSQYGQIAEKELKKLSSIYDEVSVDKYVIMPNHIHIILVLHSQAGRTQFAPTVSRIIKQFKGAVTKRIGQSVWQKSFYDHIIRDRSEYLLIWRYIDENPAKWEDDCYYQP